MQKIFVAAILAVGICLNFSICTTHAAGVLWGHKYVSYCDYCNKVGNRTLWSATAGLNDFRGKGLEDAYPAQTKALAAENCPNSPTKHHSFTKIRVMHFMAPANAKSAKEVTHFADEFVESEHFFAPVEMGLAVQTGKKIDPPPQFYGSKEVSKLSPEETAKRAKLQENAASTVQDAVEKYRSKNYAESKELFSRAIEINPHDYHTHDLFARSMYHEKSKEKDFDKIISESKKAIELAPDNESKADCYSFLAKVYRKLAMNNLFNTNNKTNYSELAQKCTDMANKLRMSK